jgi:FMN phosphatase YigB (HAD superfamily)
MDANVCERADCAFPATIDVVRELAASYDLHTATGNPSWRVEALLAQWGVRELFGVTSGPDLVGVMKDTARFHRRVFALAGVSPSRAIVVDDAPSHLARARAAGARTILVDPDGGARADVSDAVVADIADVPDAVRRIRPR